MNSLASALAKVDPYIAGGRTGIGWPCVEARKSELNRLERYRSSGPLLMRHQNVEAHVAETLVSFDRELFEILQERIAQGEPELTTGDAPQVVHELR